MQVSEAGGRPGVFEGAEPLHQAPSGAARSAGGRTAVADGLRSLWSGAEKKSPRLSSDNRGLRRTAATYSPNWRVSTIGDGELNFSVRNGKRWILTAITTAVYYLREKFSEGMFPSGITVRVFATSWLIFLLGKSFGPLVQVS